MITTICLNPCFDKTVEMDTLELGAVNRIRRMRTDPGGKGVNVAVVAHRLGLDVKCIGAMGEDGAEELLDMMGKEGLKTRFLKIPGRVRTNMKLLIQGQKGVTELNEPGARMTEKNIEDFFAMAREETKDSDIVVINLSLIHI